MVETAMKEEPPLSPTDLVQHFFHSDKVSATSMMEKQRSGLSFLDIVLQYIGLGVCSSTLSLIT
jgi:hypothetical protein